MKLLLWICLSVAALVCEVVILPKFFGAGVPVLSFAIVLMSIVFQDFWNGLLYAGIAGIMRDVFSAPSYVSYTVFFVLLFLLMRLFMMFSGWDEAARRIGALVVALLGMPLTGNIRSFIIRVLFHGSPPYISLGDVFSIWFLTGSLFALVFAGAFSWGMVRYARRHRIAIGSHV